MSNAQFLADTARPEKSTNGRLRPLTAPLWVRMGFRALSAVSTGGAAGLARRIFFTPPRRRLRDEERAVLERGAAMTLGTRFGPAAGRVWGSGPAVLLVHGWGGQSGQMTALVEPILAAGLRAVALDMPAHGESAGRLSSLMHFSAVITRAAAIFGPLRGLVGHSLGAAACVHALAHGVEAERVVFFAPAGRFEPVWSRFRTGLGLSAAVWERMRAEAEIWLDVKFDETVPAVLAAKMTAPLIVFHDSDDREVAFSEGAELARLWPGAALRPTEGLGHVRILKDRDCIREAARFLASRAQ